MIKNLSFALIALAMVNCTAMQENGLRNSRRDPEEESFERARSLYQIGEVNAAIKKLRFIIDERPQSRTGMEAVLFCSDIYVAQQQPQKALEILRQFEMRMQGRKFDLSLVREAKNRAEKAMNSPPEAPVEPLVSTSETSDSSRDISYSIGVLLPLSGPYKVYGERALAAMRLALNPISARNDNDVVMMQNQDGFSLIVMDSKGQNEASERAVDRFIDDYHVGVIVGDILTDTAVAIAKRAEERGVINLSLSRKDGITSVGARIFRMAITAKKQASALLSKQDEIGARKRYAVLYPENAFGVEMRDAFVSEAKKRGANVTKMEGYKSDETTFTSIIRKLVGGKKTAGNAGYTQCLEKTLRLSDVPARKKAENDCYDAIAPSIPFDALFIPEFPKTLGYIVPALISEGIMVSQNENMVRSYRKTSYSPNAESVQLLGPNTWNNALVGEKLGSQVDGALFVDGGDLFDSRQEAVQFVNGFKNAQNSAPTLADAFAFDAVRVLHEVLGKSPNQEKLNIETIAGALLASEFNGVSGKISFDQERESVIPFRWFAFQEGKILPKS